MKVLFICNKREKYIIDLQKHLSKEKEVKILQINGFKLYKNEKEYEEFLPKGVLSFLNRMPKIKVFTKILNVKKIVSNKGKFDHIVLFYNNWTLKYLFPSLLKNSKSVSFYFDSFPQIKNNKNLFQKANSLIFSDSILKKEFEKLYQNEFAKKSFICHKGVEFKNIESKEKKSVYCDIKEVKDIKEFVNSLNKEFFYTFPMIGESFERRKELKEILEEKSELNYQISNSFLSKKENLSLIANSKFVIALTNPRYSQTIQHSLYLKKICIIYEKFINFFDEKEFHFVTIKKSKELSNISERVKEYEVYKDKNAENIYALFSFENIVKNCKKILERG